MHSTIPNLSAAGQAIGDYLTALSEEHIEVPMLPDVANRVLQLSNDPESDAAQLAKLIQSDQSLAGHVMRIANSAAYSPNGSMVSLQQAVARLGMQLIMEIALSASLSAKLFNAPPYDERIKSIWTHALCTALWGKEVARISKKNVEAAFLCGLLHSVGCPISLQLIYEYAQKKGLTIAKEEAYVLEQAFQNKFGQVIVQKWGMPVIVQNSVHYYQHYNDSKKFRDQAMVTNAAVKLAHDTLKTEDEEKHVVVSDAVFADLNLYEDEIEALQAQEDKVKAALGAMQA